jgi:hypothetical protein
MVQSSKVAVVTSRLRRLIEPDDVWIKGLRAVLRRIAAQPCRLVISPQTAGSEFIRRGASRCGITVELVEPSADENPSPDPSARDQFVITRADVIYVLAVRTNGNIHRLVRDKQRMGHSRIILVDLPDLQSEIVKKELIAGGAEVWQPTISECEQLETSLNENQTRNGDTDLVCQVSPFPNAQDWQYLTHTTRSCPGPWPDESFDEYADSLLESRSEADHSPLGALMRIVRQKLIHASNQAIRGGFSTVSFTECPLEQLHSLHCFRPHRTRWDFEPYGLCLRRSSLISREIHPVIYGDESTWQSLSDSDRAFFQVAVGQSGIDWTIEREWRHAGNLDLSVASANDVLLFVPNYESARSLAQITDWPITLWPDPAVQSS